MVIRERHVVYVQGYDPRGLAHYYRLFRTELRKFSQVSGVSTTIRRPSSDPEGLTASWTLETEGPGWQTTTASDFLRWEDLIKSDFEIPIWRVVPRAFLLMFRMIFAGTISRFWSAHWRFAIFVLYPYLVVLAEVLASLGLAVAIGEISAAIGLPGFAAAALAIMSFVAGVAALVIGTERWTWALYLLRDIIFTWEFAHHQRPLWTERIDRFALRLIELANRSNADEIVIVGHSSGSFLSTEIVARALKLDPSLGSRGPRMVLLTLGANLPIVGFHAPANGFRDNLGALANAASIDWIDCQSRKDVMNFYPFDPIGGHGIQADSQRRNPAIVSVRFRDVIKAENYRRFRRRFFRVHFQFVMANETPNIYDFYMIACGPVPLHERFTAGDLIRANNRDNATAA